MTPPSRPGCPAGDTSHGGPRSHSPTAGSLAWRQARLFGLSPSRGLTVSGETEQVTEPHVNHILPTPQGTGKKAETNAAPW